MRIKKSRLRGIIEGMLYEEESGLSWEQKDVLQKFWASLGGKVVAAYKSIDQVRHVLGGMSSLDSGEAIPDLRDALEDAHEALTRLMDVASKHRLKTYS